MKVDSVTIAIEQLMEFVFIWILAKLKSFYYWQ